MTSHSMAVIFDVDGPLLELTPPETAAFFVPFTREYGLTGLSEDWDSYRIRNDVEIYREILRDQAGVADFAPEVDRLSRLYFDHLETLFDTGEAVATPIHGAKELLHELQTIDGLALGTSTANFETAAELRLKRAGLWQPVSRYHFGADGGGAKRDVLARAIHRLQLPGDRVVFLGDNLNDLDAAIANGTHFIGFHLNANNRQRLTDAGAKTVTGDHRESLRLIRQFLSLPDP